MNAPHEGGREGRRYSAVSIGLHWTIAALIALQIPLGWRMGDMDDGMAKFELFQLHKSVGITILALSLLRLFWRITHPAPPLPDHMAAWEKVFARATHVGFYVFMIVTPLIGWAMVSASPMRIPTLVWNVIPLPHFPLLEWLGEDDAEDLAEELSEVHGAFAWFGVALLGLHVAGALKHHLLDRDDVLWRMLPLVRPLGRRSR